MADSPQLQADLWVHGPFDSNFFLWFKEDGGLHQALIEYDHLLWIYQNGKVTLERSSSAMEENRGYLAPDALFLDSPASARVVMGASWIDRLLKIVENSEPKHSWGALFHVLNQILRNQRQQ